LGDPRALKGLELGLVAQLRANAKELARTSLSDCARNYPANQPHDAPKP
jgi:hypothetical protein